jgi:hypothetical protein
VGGGGHDRPLDDETPLIARQMARGKVIPFLGAGANLAAAAGADWARGERLPSGAELADHLAARYPKARAGGRDLLRVAQYVATLAGTDLLYDDLHDVFSVACRPTAVHEFLATLPARLRARGRPQPVIVTTNYDDLMERALEAAGEAYDVLWYEAKPNDAHRGRFWHRRSGEDEARVVERPNDGWGADADPAERRPAVVKVHGAVSLADEERDSYVVTEDDYIEYLGASDLGSRIPSVLLDPLRNCHFLFLGYGLRDWNLRMILGRIWEQQALPRRSWAVQREVAELEARLWEDRNVTLLDMDLAAFIQGLRAALDGLGSERGAP